MEVSRSGILAQNTPQVVNNRLRTFKIQRFDDELDLINGVADLVTELDPDILTGWEVQLNSWGFLEARAHTHGTLSSNQSNNELTRCRDLSFSDLISRASARQSGSNAVNQWASRKASTFKVAGRHVLNLWRIMRSEKTLPAYTFENVVFDVLRKRWGSFCDQIRLNYLFVGFQGIVSKHSQNGIWVQWLLIYLCFFNTSWCGCIQT